MRRRQSMDCASVLTRHIAAAMGRGVEQQQMALAFFARRGGHLQRGGFFHIANIFVTGFGGVTVVAKAGQIVKISVIDIAM